MKSSLNIMTLPEDGKIIIQLITDSEVTGWMSFDREQAESVLKNLSAAIDKLPKKIAQ